MRYTAHAYMNIVIHLLTYIRQRRVFFFITTLIVLVIAGFVLQLFTTKKTITRVKVPTFLPQQAATNVIFEGDIPFPTPTFPLYTVDGHLTLDTQFTKIADHLNLVVAPYSSNLYLSTDKTKTLTRETIQGFIYFSNSANSIKDATQSVDKNSATQLGKDFIKLMGFSSDDFSLDETHVQYLVSHNGELEEAATGPSINLRFIRTIHSFPLTIGASTITYIDLFISSSGVFKARFPALILSLHEQNSLPHLTTDQVKQQIKAGKYKLLGTPLDPKTGSPVLSSFSSFILHMQNFEYRLDERSNILIPFVHLIGTGIPNTSMGEVPVEIVTPAIPTQ